VGAEEGGPAWLGQLPTILDRCVEAWGLELGAPFLDAQVSYVVAARTENGDEAVLKIAWPHRESAHEVDALLRWGGAGAILVLEHDARSNAMLLERCVPGSHLSTLDEGAALDVLIGIVPRLLVPAGEPFTLLTEEAAWWLGSLEETWERAGRPFSTRLLHAAAEALRELPGSASGEAVLLHQDLHGDNVLRAHREPWLVIDPKPLVGERAFAAAPIVRSYEFGHDQRSVRERLDRLTAELELDRERARLWAMAQTVAWSIDESGADPWHVQTAEWLLDAI
jgi:streptomycin 6-kinase